MYSVMIRDNKDHSVLQILTGKRRNHGRGF